jgi:hypothetical protein
MFQNIFEYTVKRAPALVENISSVLEQTMLDPVSSTKDKVHNKNRNKNLTIQRTIEKILNENIS